MLDFFLEDNLAQLSLQDRMISRKQKKTDSVQDAGKPEGKIPRIFAVIEANLNNELVTKTGAIYQFNVKGNQSSVIIKCFVIVS